MSDKMKQKDSSISYEPGKLIPLSRIQKITGEKMVQSKQHLPCFYLSTEVDMTNLVGFRLQFNQANNEKISFNDFMIKAIAASLKQFPLMTGQLQDNNVRIADAINVGLAISAGDDLMAPVVKNADAKTVIQIAADTKGLIERVRSEKVTVEDIIGGCCTLSNLGAFGVSEFIPIVIPGQCSIIGVGKIAERGVPISGKILIRKMMNLTISVDHRIVNGTYAARFIQAVKERLEKPEFFGCSSGSCHVS